jgi:hypothetical protein
MFSRGRGLDRYGLSQNTPAVGLGSTLGRLGQSPLDVPQIIRTQDWKCRNSTATAGIFSVSRGPTTAGFASS